MTLAALLSFTIIRLGYTRKYCDFLLSEMVDKILRFIMNQS